MEILEDPAPVGDGEILENSPPVIASLDLDLTLMESLEVCPHTSAFYENIVIPKETDFQEACNGLINSCVVEQDSSRESGNQRKHKGQKRKIASIRAELEDSVQPAPILPSKSDQSKKLKQDKKHKKELLSKEIEAKRDAKNKKS